MAKLAPLAANKGPANPKVKPKRSAREMSRSPVPQARLTANIDIDLEDFACSICQELMMTDILQCSEGHAICRECFSGLPALSIMARSSLLCPTCREPYPGGVPVRNWMMEAMVAKLDLPCKHGCGFQGKASEMVNHVTGCMKRKVACPNNLCNDMVRLDELPAHFRENHANNYHVGSKLAGWCGMKLQSFDKQCGSECKLIDFVESGFVLQQLNYWHGLDMATRVTPQHRCDIVQLRSIHVGNMRQVTASIICDGEQMIQGPRAPTDPLNGGGRHVDNLQMQLSDKSERDKHLFFCLQLENCIGDRKCNIRVVFEDVPDVPRHPG